MGLLLSGCQQTRPQGLVSSATDFLHQKPSAETAPDYSALVLNYETTDFGSLLTKLRPANVSAELSGRLQQVSAQEPVEQESPKPNGQWSHARIQIIYPHPDGSQDKGLARLIVSRDTPQQTSPQPRKLQLKGSLSRLMLKASGTSQELASLVDEPEQQKPVDEEIWQLDLAKEELDILLSELSHRGFFEEQERPRGEAVVTIRVDEGALSKRWTSEPRLEGLMMQVYNEGELAAFNTRTSRISQISHTQSRPQSLDG